MSVGVLYAQIKAQEGLWLCLAPSALLMGIALYVPFTKQKYSKILKMTYRCDGDSAENRCFGETHALDVTLPFFAYELTVSFTAATGQHGTNIFMFCPISLSHQFPESENVV